MSWPCSHDDVPLSHAGQAPGAAIDTPFTLLQRLRDDLDQRAWNEFVELYTPLLYRWARRAGLGEDDAADLIQDVFVVLVREMPKFDYDPGRSFRAWLKTLLLNRWRNLHKRASRQQPAGAGELDQLEAADAFADLGEQEYRELIARRALDLMREEFQPATWQACWRVVVEGEAVAAVARDLGMSENAVYVARCRVLARLRQNLRGLLG